jgi:hypothetical protein
MKKEFICVQPKSNKAKIHFTNLMDSLHSCRVEERKDGQVLLASITNKYLFWLPEKGNEHWEIVK